MWPAPEGPKTSPGITATSDLRAGPRRRLHPTDRSGGCRRRRTCRPRACGRECQAAVQCRDDQAGAALIGASHGLDLGELAPEREGGSVLNERLGAEQHDLGDRLHADGELLGADGPAGAIAGHRVGFRQGRDDDGALGKGGLVEGRGEAAVAEHQSGIDLIGDDPQIMLLADLADRQDLVAGQHGTGRIGRAVEQQHAALRRDGALEIGGREVKPGLGGEAYRHEGGTGGGDHSVIGDVIGLGHDDLIAERGEGHHGAEGVLRAGGEDHLLRRNLATRSGENNGRNRSNDPWLATAVGIAGPPGAQLANRFLDNIRGASRSGSPIDRKSTSSPRTAFSRARKCTCHFSMPRPARRSVMGAYRMVEASRAWQTDLSRAREGLWFRQSDVKVVGMVEGTQMTRHFPASPIPISPPISPRFMTGSTRRCEPFASMLGRAWPNIVKGRQDVSGRAYEVYCPFDREPWWRGWSRPTRKR